MVQGLHWLEAMSGNDFDLAKMPHDEDAFFRGVYAMGLPFRETMRNLAIAAQRTGKAFKRWDFARDRQRVTCSSVNKRNSHAKRPGGRR